MRNRIRSCFFRRFQPVGRWRKLRGVATEAQIEERTSVCCGSERDQSAMLPTSLGSTEAMKVDPLDLTCGTTQNGATTSQGREGVSSTNGSSPAAGYSGFEPSSVATEEPHRCDICGKTFAVPARLTRHYRTHTGERPFVCELCGKSFSVKENLSVHRRIHTKEKPYGCTHCGRGFEHSGKLHRHMRIHTGERPHQCTDCGKTFIQSGQLVIHMRSHTGEKPYVCSVCHKGFTCSKQLKVHSRTHTGERPYACDVCGKTFAYNHVLKLHQMAHLGERLYKCTLCSETYSSKKALETHIKSHSSANPRLSPVPSTSSRPTAADARHELQAVRSSRNLTSGGSFVERNHIGGSNSTVTPSIVNSLELGNSRSPCSAESSRSSSSDVDSVAGPSSVMEFVAAQKSASPAAATWQILNPLDSLNHHNDQLRPQTMDPAHRPPHLLSHNLGRQPPFAESTGSHHYAAQAPHRQVKERYPGSALPPMPLLVPVTNFHRAGLSVSQLAGPKVRESELQPNTGRTRGIPASGTNEGQASAGADNGTLSNVPPRKQARFRHGGETESDCSGGSDSSRENSPYSPPDCIIPAKINKCSNVSSSLKSDDGISAVHADQVMRSTSVICFARRPSSSNSPSSQ